MFLQRTARALSRARGSKVTPGQVLELLVELAITDEGVYDPEDGSPLVASNRTVRQAPDNLYAQLLRLGEP